MGVMNNDSDVKQVARQPLLGNGVKVFGIVTLIFYAAIFVTASIGGMLLPAMNPPAILVMLLSAMSFLLFISIPLAVIRTALIVGDLDRSHTVPGYARVLFVILSILPLAINLLSIIASLFHHSFGFESIERYSRLMSTISALNVISSILLPAAIGAYLVPHSIKGGKRELAIAAFFFVQVLVRFVAANRLSVDEFVIIDSILAIVIMVATSAIRITVLSDLAKADWKYGSKTAAAV